MPHKHRRDRRGADWEFFNLPPSKKANALPVGRRPPTSKSKAVKLAAADDTPRAFARLFTKQRPPRSGLDDGSRPSKKRKLEPSHTEAQAKSAEQSITAPKILYNESLGEFAARVDATLPFKGVDKSAGTAAKGIVRERQTKTERKMQKMQKQWREEDRRLREKADADASSDDGLDDDRGHLDSLSSQRPKKGKKRKVGKNRDEEGDIWSQIQSKPLAERDDGKSSGGLVGLHDVVQGPPQLSKFDRDDNQNRLKIRHGGLKRQGELQEVRSQVVAGYRQLMQQRKVDSTLPP